MKITYLLGAGASANTIPVVANFRHRMMEMRTFLQTQLNPQFDSQNKSPKVHSKYHDAIRDIIGDFDWIIDEAGEYFTIDTLAKKYYLKDEMAEMKRLKKVLITYFTLEQYIFVRSIPNENYTFQKNSIDKRYDSFIASIAQKSIVTSEKDKLSDEWTNIRLNDDIKILSWNYDLQFERSVQRFASK